MTQSCQILRFADFQVSHPAGCLYNLLFQFMIFLFTRFHHLSYKNVFPLLPFLHLHHCRIFSSIFNLIMFFVASHFNLQANYASLSCRFIAFIYFFHLFLKVRIFIILLLQCVDASQNFIFNNSENFDCQLRNSFIAFFDQIWM